MPTLTPALKRVPRCRTRIEPAVTFSPPNSFTPRRFALLSRPLRELPTPFLCAIPCLLFRGFARGFGAGRGRGFGGVSPVRPVGHVGRVRNSRRPCFRGRSGGHGRRGGFRRGRGGTSALRR